MPANLAPQDHLRDYPRFRPMPIEAAEKMHLEDLQYDFWAACDSLHCGIGTCYLPADFPSVEFDQAPLLRRDDILRMLRRHAYWFDPKGGHPVPNKPAYYVFKVWWEWPAGSAGEPEDAPWAIALGSHEFDQAIAEAEALWRTMPHGDGPDGYTVGTPIGAPEFSRFLRGPRAGESRRWRHTDNHPYAVAFEETTGGLVPRYTALPRPEPIKSTKS